MSEERMYPDDFEEAENDPVDVRTSLDSASVFSSTTSPKSPACGAAGAFGGTQRLAGNFQKRNVDTLPAAHAENAQVLHNSKTMSVAMLAPDAGNNYYATSTPTEIPDTTRPVVLEDHDPCAATTKPSCVRRQDVRSSSTFTSSTSMSSSSSSSTLSSSLWTSLTTRASERILASRLEKGNGEGAGDVANYLPTLPEDENADNVQSCPVSRGKNFHDFSEVHVWKRHSIGHGPIPQSTKAIEIPRPHKMIKEARLLKRGLKKRSDVTPSPASKRNAAAPKRQAVQSNSVETPQRRSVLTNERVSCDTPEALLKRRIAEVQYKLESVRRARRALEERSKLSLKIHRKWGIRWRGKTREYIEEDNNHLRFLLQLSSDGKKGLELLVYICEEELKYAREKLRLVKVQLRELKTENRRTSIIFTEIAKHRPPAREQVARQQREGMYNRFQLQTKAEHMREAIEMTRETSSHLTKQIQQLEERVKREGLTEMKASDYTALQMIVEKNSKLIDRLTASVTALQNKHDGLLNKEKMHRDVADDVDFRGREEMEKTLQKLLKLLKRKDEQIKAYRANLADAHPTTPVAARKKTSAGMGNQQEQSQLQENGARCAPESQRTANKAGRPDGPQTTPRAEARTSSQAPPFKKRTMKPQQVQKQQQERTGRSVQPRDGDRTRLSAQKRAVLSPTDPPLLSQNPKHRNDDSPAAEGGTSSRGVSGGRPTMATKNNKKRPASGSTRQVGADPLSCNGNAESPSTSGMGFSGSQDLLSLYGKPTPNAAADLCRAGAVGLGQADKTVVGGVTNVQETRENGKMSQKVSNGLSGNAGSCEKLPLWLLDE